MAGGCIVCLCLFCSPLLASTKAGSCHATLQQFPIAIAEFQQLSGRLPTEQEGLGALVTRPADWPDGQVWKPLLSDLPKDPWGSDYQYVLLPRHPAEYGVYSRERIESASREGTIATT